MTWNIPLPSGSPYSEFVENKDTVTAVYNGVTREDAEAYIAALKEAGFAMREAGNTPERRFAALEKDGDGVFVNHYPATSELSVVSEKNTAYFRYFDECGSAVVPAQITQIALEDFGMSYAVRLEDGRYIVIDGGWENEPDADKLMACLKRGTVREKPVIAAWIMTHPHVDHYRCFLVFIKKYASDVVIEKMLYTFPGLEEIRAGKGFSVGEPILDEGGEAAGLPRFFKAVSALGVPVYAPHTGQHYRIGGAMCDILASPDDDVWRRSEGGGDLNCDSLVIRMTLSSQVILWCADALFDPMRLTARYGKALKADILQIPHHGFNGGTPDGYECIKPEVCFIPVSDQNCYIDFCRQLDNSGYMIHNLGIRELIPGSTERTVTLPYHAPWYAARDNEEKYAFGLRSEGAKCWFFADECTGTPEDMRFTITSVEIVPVTVYADIYFEKGADAVFSVKIPVAGRALTVVDFLSRTGISLEASRYNRNSLAAKGLPENARCSIRFLCDKPVVVSQKNHAAAYFA